MSKLVLHIGTHKTGTTTVQGTLASNYGFLAKNNVIFPKIGPTDGQHSLVMDWIDLPPQFSSKKSALFEWHALADTYANTDKTVIISTEELSRGNPGQRVDLEKVREACKEFDTIQVICCVRDQISFLQSIYLQLAKTNVAPIWYNFLQQAMQKHMASGVYLDYNKLYEFLLSGFTAQEINFFRYEPTVGAPLGIVGKILDLAGHGELTEHLKPLANNRNVSPNALIYWTAAQMVGKNKADPALLAISRELIASEFGEGVKTSMFSTAEKAQMVKVFAPLNQTFTDARAKLGEDLIIDWPSVDSEVVHREKITSRFWVKFARKLYESGLTAGNQTGF